MDFQIRKAIAAAVNDILSEHAKCAKGRIAMAEAAEAIKDHKDFIVFLADLLLQQNDSRIIDADSGSDDDDFVFV